MATTTLAGLALYYTDQAAKSPHPIWRSTYARIAAVLRSRKGRTAIAARLQRLASDFKAMACSNAYVGAANSVLRASETDFEVQNHGSIVLVRPLTERCRTWLEDRTDGTWWGGALAVEPRYVEALVTGMESEGFTR